MRLHLDCIQLKTMLASCGPGPTQDFYSAQLRNSVGLCQVIVAHIIVMATSHTRLWLPLNFHAPSDTCLLEMC